MNIELSKEELKYVCEALDSFGEHLTSKATSMHRDGEETREIDHYIGFGSKLFTKIKMQGILMRDIKRGAN
jgi:hypothetical protein